MITKKAASFSKEPARKNLMIDAIRAKPDTTPAVKVERTVNSSL